MNFGLIGTFDVENYGDCMFPELYAHFIAKRFKNSDIKLYSPVAKSAEILSFQEVNPLPKTCSQKELSYLNSDILILIGGETIGAGHSSGTYNFPRNTASAYLRLWLTPILARQNPDLRPKFFAIHCVGAIKTKPKISRIIARCLSCADRVRFRDEFSSNLISDNGNKFPVDVDPMFLIDQLCSKGEWKERAISRLPAQMKTDEYLVVQVSLSYLNGDLQSWINSIAAISRERNLPILLLPICHFLQDDALLRHILKILKRMDIEADISGGIMNVKDTAALIGCSAGFIGSSLHGAVTAVSFAKPLAVLGHSPDGKHEGTMRSVGIRDIVTSKSCELVSCFNNSYSSDRDSAREHAQKLAMYSIDELFNAVETLTSESRHGSLEEDAREAISIDRTIGAYSEVKRIALRIIRLTPGLSNIYSKWRLQKHFTSISNLQ